MSLVPPGMDPEASAVNDLLEVTHVGVLGSELRQALYPWFAT